MKIEKKGKEEKWILNLNCKYDIVQLIFNKID